MAPSLNEDEKAGFDHQEDVAEVDLVYADENEEPVFHRRTYIALLALFILNYVQIVALNGPPGIVSRTQNSLMVAPLPGPRCAWRGRCHLGPQCLVPSAGSPWSRCCTCCPRPRSPPRLLLRTRSKLAKRCSSSHALSPSSEQPSHLAQTTSTALSWRRFWSALALLPCHWLTPSRQRLVTSRTNLTLDRSQALAPYYPLCHEHCSPAWCTNGLAWRRRPHESLAAQGLEKPLRKLLFKLG